MTICWLGAMGCVLRKISQRLLTSSPTILWIACALTAAAANSPDSPDYRKYAPDRKVDILNVALDITPNFEEETIKGKATLTFKPIGKALKDWKLDAEELRIESVTGTAPVASFHNDDKALLIYFGEELAVGREVSVTVNYSATPKKGLYFRTPKRGYKETDTHLFTQGEDMDSRAWFPTHDYPNEKFTSEITCRVPEGMVAFANGAKVSETKEGGLTVFHWKQAKPHVSYLVCLVAGFFKGVEDTYRNIPMGFYAVPSEAAVVANSFAPTMEAMKFFEEEIGFPYPWEKYYQVCVSDFMFGGMENTSLTTLTESTLFSKESENLQDSEDLVAHELAHQWFGDVVTCKDWSHAWLNEGFATYYAHLFDGHKNGREAMLYNLYNSARGITGRRAEADTKGLVHRNYGQSMEVFSNGIYPKGAWVLHMLRGQLGEEMYRKVVKTYLERNAFQTVETHDLVKVVDELTGRSWDQFFDQWIFRPHFPQLNVSYSWDETAKLAKLNVRQTQPVTNEIGLFNFLMKVRFKVGDAKVDREIQVKEKAEDFYFKLEKAPAAVRLDPDLVLLAKTTFSPPKAMILEQLKEKDDVIGRLQVVESLKGDSSDENVKRLKELVNGDSFYGVRQEAVAALKGMKTTAALEALIASLKQSDARVRVRVVDAIGAFYSEKAFEAIAGVLESEKNPNILAEAIQALAASPGKEATEKLIGFLNSNSFHQLLANRAISALRARRDVAAIGPLMDTLEKRWDEFPTNVRGTALGALADLARDEEAQRPKVRELLAKHVNDPRESTQIAAIRALGALRDERAIPILETFASAARETPTRVPAESALNAIRTARNNPAEPQALRNEVMDLKKENREMREEMKTLSQKLQALTKEPASTNKADKAKNAKPAPRKK